MPVRSPLLPLFFRSPAHAQTVPAIAAPRLWRIGVRYSGRVF